MGHNYILYSDPFLEGFLKNIRILRELESFVADSKFREFVVKVDFGPV